MYVCVCRGESDNLAVLQTKVSWLVFLSHPSCRDLWAAILTKDSARCACGDVLPLESICFGRLKMVSRVSWVCLDFLL